MVTLCKLINSDNVQDSLVSKDAAGAAVLSYNTDDPPVLCWTA